MKQLTHASTFSGIGGPEVAAAMLGWENIFHCEINPFGRRVLDYWFPNAKSYEDITKTDFTEWRGRVTVLTGGFPCFPKGVLITTGDGLKPIENVRSSDMILTKEGEWKRCNAVIRQRKRKFTCISAEGLIEPLVATDNHPFWVIDELGRETWKEAGKLLNGEKIAFRCIEGTDTSYTPELWRLIGRYLGDGWYNNNKRTSKITFGRGSRKNSYEHKIIICCAKSEKDELRKIIEGAGYHATLSEDKSTYRFIICNKELCEIVKQFGKYAYGKKLTGQAFQLDYERKKALYEGYLSADGYIDKNGVMTTTTVSKELALGIAQIARDVFKRPVNISTKKPKRVCNIEGREVSERISYVVRIAPTDKYNRYQNGFIFIPIKNIEHKYERRTVYNIGVEESETYTANSVVVHNCQPFSYAGKRGGAEDDRYLWPFMLRCIEQVRPRWFVGENVAGITTMVEPGEVAPVAAAPTLFAEDDPLHRYEYRQPFTIERICRELERIGYSVQPILIPACAVGAPHRRDRVFFVARDERDVPEDTMCERQLHGQYDEPRGQRHERNAGTGDCERICSSAQRADIAHTQEQPSERLRPEQPETGNAQQERSGRGGGEDGSPRHAPHPHGDRGSEVDEHIQSRLADGTEPFGYGRERNAADTAGQRPQGHIDSGEQAQTRDGHDLWRYIAGHSGQDGIDTLGSRWSNFPSVSPVHRGNDGLPFPVDNLTIPFAKWRTESLKAYGNAIVPQVMYEIFLAIQNIETNGALQQRL